jgi:hypothetical protein
MNQSSSDESDNGVEDKSVQPNVHSQQERRHVLTQFSQISSDDETYNFQDKPDPSFKSDDVSDASSEERKQEAKRNGNEKNIFNESDHKLHVDSSDDESFVKRYNDESDRQQQALLNSISNIEATESNNSKEESCGDDSEDDKPLISMKKNNTNDDTMDVESSDDDMIFKIKVNFSNLPSFKQTTIKANGKLSVPKKRIEVTAKPVRRRKKVEKVDKNRFFTQTMTQIYKVEPVQQKKNIQKASL